MPEIIITYEKPETLNILKGLTKYLDFTFSSKKKTEKINGVSFIPGNPSIDITPLKEIFTEYNIDAKKLREEAWRRSR